MGRRDGEITAQEAAAMLGLKTPESVYGYEKRGLLTSRAEQRGILGRVRRFYQRAQVEALRAEAEHK